MADEWGLDQADHDWLDNVFTYHAPRDGQVETYQLLREHGRVLAASILRNVPPGEERQQALFAVRAAVMWANAGIACSWPSSDG